MAQWRKVIVSGSNSELNNISSSGDFVMSKDGAKMKFGADNEVTLTHQHNAGLLLSDDSLYNNLNKTAFDLDKLLKHINENPKHFFAPLGKSRKKIERDLRKQKED